SAAPVETRRRPSKAATSPGSVNVSANAGPRSALAGPSRTASAVDAGGPLATARGGRPIAVTMRAARTTSVIHAIDDSSVYGSRVVPDQEPESFVWAGLASPVTGGGRLHLPHSRCRAAPRV